MSSTLTHAWTKKEEISIMLLASAELLSQEYTFLRKKIL